MAIDKVLPRYLNKDDDERLIKKVEMTDAQNIRISSDEDGNGLVIKNAYGNEAVTLSDSLPSGTNVVVGAVADDHLVRFSISFGIAAAHILSTDIQPP